MVTKEQIEDWLAGLQTYGMGDGEYWIPTKESFEKLCQLGLEALARPEGAGVQPIISDDQINELVCDLDMEHNRVPGSLSINTAHHAIREWVEGLRLYYPPQEGQ